VTLELLFQTLGFASGERIDQPYWLFGEGMGRMGLMGLMVNASTSPTGCLAAREENRLSRSGRTSSGNPVGVMVQGWLWLKDPLTVSARLAASLALNSSCLTSAM